MRTVIIVLYGLHLIDVGIVLYHKGLDHRIIYDLGTFKHIQQLGIGYNTFRIFIFRQLER